VELYFYAPTCCTLDYNLQPTIPTIRKSGFTPIYAKHCISPHFRAIPQDRSQAPAKVCSLCFAAHLHVWIMEKPCHSHQKSPATIAPKRGETDIGQHLYIYLHGKITATPLYGYQLN